MPRASVPQPRQRGTIVEEGEGKWRVRIFAGNETVNGKDKRIYVSELVIGTYNQADKKRTAMLRELDTNTLARPTGETVAEFVERFLTDVKTNEVLDATMRGYRIQQKNHIVPALGRIKLHDLTTQRIQQWIGAMAAKGLSYSAVRHAYVVLDMALSAAVQWNIISKNPATAATLPARLKAERKEMATFTPDQMHRFLVGIDTARAQYRAYKPFFLMLLTLGLRPSEACALRWSDIDMDAAKLTINRSLTQVTSGHWIVKNIPKTASGRRRLSMSRALVSELRSHRARQAQARLAAGPEWMDADFVFTTKHGNHLMPNNVSRAWRVLCAHAGVPIIRLYDSRHTAATLELMAGVDPKTVSQRRGHANVAFTLDTYAHVLDSMDEGAADAMDDVLTNAANNSLNRQVSNG